MSREYGQSWTPMPRPEEQFQNWRTEVAKKHDQKAHTPHHRIQQSGTQHSWRQKETEETKAQKRRKQPPNLREKSKERRTLLPMLVDTWKETGAGKNNLFDTIKDLALWFWGFVLYYIFWLYHAIWSTEHSWGHQGGHWKPQWTVLGTITLYLYCHARKVSFRTFVQHWHNIPTWSWWSEVLHRKTSRGTCWYTNKHI